MSVQRFNFYEVVAILIPGLYLGTGLAILYLPPQQWKALLTMGAGAGAILLLLAYATGFLVHRLAGRIQDLWWGWIHGGQPTDWVLRNQGACPRTWAVWTDTPLLSESQMTQLGEILPERLPVSEPDDGLRFPEDETEAIRRQVLAYLNQEGTTTRIDRMSGNHRMGLGILTANLVLSALYLGGMSLGDVPHRWWASILLAATTVVAGLTIIRSGQNYATELFSTFLATSEEAQHD